MPELSCLESRLISELQGAPGSRDHQASPSSLFGYQNTTAPQMARGPGNIAIALFMLSSLHNIVTTQHCHYTILSLHNIVTTQYCHYTPLSLHNIVTTQPVTLFIMVALPPLLYLLWLRCPVTLLIMVALPPLRHNYCGGMHPSWLHGPIA